MSQTKKRILIVSDSIFRETGYSTVAKNIIKQLSDKYDIAQLGLADTSKKRNFDNLNIDYYSPIKDHTKCCGRGHLIEYFDRETRQVKDIIPGFTLSETDHVCDHGHNFNPADTFSEQSAFHVIQHFKPDIVMPINDVWALYHFNFLKNRRNFYFMPYLAIDSECFPVTIDTKKPNMPPINTLQFISNSDKIVVFTEWAQETINTTTKIITNGKIPNNISIIPHGVNNDEFKPLDNKTEIRKNYFNIDDNVFLIGSVARNQPRKRLDAIFQVMRSFIDKYEKPNGKKIMTHFHCSMKDNMGWDLPWLAAYYNLTDRCIFDDKLRPGIGVPTNILNEIINTYDVHMLLTSSEGWALPIIETMAAGVPNIITDYSAHGDWAGDAALKVKISEKIHDVKTNHIKGIASISHATKQLSYLYNSDKMCREYSRNSLKLAKELDWENVCSMWESTINMIDVSHLDDNRYNLELLSSDNLIKLPEDPINTSFKLMEI